MDFPLYDATDHPNNWLNQVQTKCILASIRTDKEILKLCKLNISNSINISDEINGINELIKALKAHPSFTIFKNDCKSKLDNMKFEGGDTATFLAEVRKLCNNAEITDNEEIRRRLLNTYSSNEFFRNEFAKRATRTTKVDDMFKIYSEVVSDDDKVIRYGPETSISLKHVATGRYLTSLEINYQTGSERQVVFAGDKLPNENSKWSISYETAPEREKYQANIVLYDDLINLNHKKTGCTLSLNSYFKSPRTGNAEVHCFRYIAANLRCIKTSQSTNKTPYLKRGDIINIKSESGTFSLSSHDVTFAINDNSFQEVSGHREKVGRDDEWQIELHR